MTTQRTDKKSVRKMYCMWSIDHIWVILSLLPRDERISSLLAQNHVLYFSPKKVANKQSIYDKNLKIETSNYHEGLTS